MVVVYWIVHLDEMRWATRGYFDVSYVLEESADRLDHGIDSGYEWLDDKSKPIAMEITGAGVL